MTARQEMRDTVARALCCHRDQPCAFCTTEAGLAVVAMAEAGYLRHPQTGDGAGAPGGGSPPSAGAVNTAPSPPHGPEPSRDCLIVDRDNDVYRYEKNAWLCLTESNFGSWADLWRYGPFRVYAPLTGGGAGDTPPATSAAPLDPAAQAGEAIGSPTPSLPFPRRFRLYRHEDPSGVSGTKWVAEGIQFIDGYTALRWFGEHPCTVPWDSIDRIIAVHGHGGLTEIVWLDGES